jgi:hypothetical protein
MNMATLYGAKGIEGLHNEPQRFPYAALAAQLNDRDRDHFTRTIQRYPLWTDGGREVARGIAGRVLADARLPS